MFVDKIARELHNNEPYNRQTLTTNKHTHQITKIHQKHPTY